MAQLPLRSAYWLTLLLIAFFLHLPWEYLQCQAFFVHGSVPNTGTAMVVATLGDVALTFVVYGGVTWIARSRTWPLERWRWPVWAALESLAVVLSVAIEIIALNNGRWAYTDSAPRVPVFGVSIVPVLQLMILLPLSFILARMLYSRRPRSEFTAESLW